MSELNLVSKDVKELFDDSDLDMGRILKKLAEAFGASATLEQVYNIYITYKLPTREIDGKQYVAGYKGSERVQDGWYEKATLIDVKQSGKECKLMFAINNKFLYQTLDEFTLNEVVSYAKDIGGQYKVLVIAEKIPATGDFHSVINTSEKA